MIEKYVSIETLMAKIILDVGSDANLKYSSIKEWVGEVIRKIAVAPILIRKNSKLDVVNYRAEKPCDLYYTICLTYKDCKLRYGNDIRNHTTNREYGLALTEEAEQIDDRVFASNYDLIYTLNSSGELVKTSVNPVPVNYMYQLDTKINRGTDYYYIEGDWYKFSFEVNEIDYPVEVDYYAFYTDANNYPMIPDNTYFLESCYWYVMMKLIGTGWTHPLFKETNSLQSYKFAQSEFQQNFQMARGTMLMPSMDQLDKFYNSYVKLFPNIHELDHYRHNTESIANERYTAG